MVTIIAFVDEGLGNSSYLVDLGDGRGLVVDPTRDVSAARLGATVLVPRAGRHEFPHRGLLDSEELDLGGLTPRTIGTPGHTPEHLGYLLLDGSRPVALFSGGALLVGSVARTGGEPPGAAVFGDHQPVLAGLTVDEVEAAVRDGAELVDVRPVEVLAAGHIPGAALVELGSVAAQAGDLASEAVTVMCGHAERATTAASLLERAGGRPAVFVGGAGDWSRALGRPLATGA